MAVATGCRTCMGQEPNMTELFKPASRKVTTMIEFCTGVLIRKKDGLPTHICSKCLGDLHISHKFKKTCVESEKTLQEMIKGNNNNMKNEFEKPKSFTHSKVDSVVDCNPSNHNAIQNDDMKKDSESVEKINKKSETVATEKTKLRKKFLKQMFIGVRDVSCDIKATSKVRINTFKRLYCEPCKLAFNNRKESQEHMKTIHKKEKSWICEKCGKSYVHQSSQIAHMQSHNPARYICDDCNYSTYNKYDFIKHVRIHTGDKCYKCPRCSAAYYTSSNLRTHVRQVHEKRCHICQTCGKMYKEMASLKRHIDTHDKVKRHICGVCDARFTRRSYWKIHLEKRHEIVIPSCRPGKPKAEILLVEEKEKEKIT